MASTVVVGLGTTGLACARFLRERGVVVAVTDSRANPPGLDRARQDLPDLQLALGGFDRSLLARAREIVLSPGVSAREPAVAEAMARGVPVISEIELFSRYATRPVVAITGSNGKSTVTTIAGLMAERSGLDVAVGGNLGTPALQLLRTPQPELYVLELSSFQLETTDSLRPAAATVLNISPDHMDRYDDLAQYVEAKRRVFKGDGVMVLNADDSHVLAMANPSRRCITFNLGRPVGEGFGVVGYAGHDWIVFGETPVMPVRELRLPGCHNLANAMAALALGRSVGLKFPDMAAVLKDFSGLPHRTQWVARAEGVNWYDDSKGTNVGATIAAVSGMPGPLVLIAGGDGKGADFAPLRSALKGKVRCAVLIGRDADLIEAALGGEVPTVRAVDMRDAVRRSAGAARPGDSVLLSPACASFDMFESYAQRGEVFQAAVREVLAC